MSTKLEEDLKEVVQILIGEENRINLQTTNSKDPIHKERLRSEFSAYNHTRQLLESVLSGNFNN